MSKIILSDNTEIPVSNLGLINTDLALYVTPQQAQENLLNFMDREKMGEITYISGVNKFIYRGYDHFAYFEQNQLGQTIVWMRGDEHSSHEGPIIIVNPDYLPKE